MTRNWRRSFGRVITLFALLVAAQLAHSGEACFATMGQEALGMHAAIADRCVEAAAVTDACITTALRVCAGAAAVGPLSPESPPVAAGAEYFASIARGTGVPPLPIGLSPAPPTPVHILLRRFLS